MKRKIIYQKKYSNPPSLPNVDLNEKNSEVSFEIKNVLQARERRKRNFVRRLFRKIKTKEFIKKSICIAELYELDILISQHTWGTTVELSFDSSGFLTKLKKVLILSDQIAFSSGVHGREITILLNLDA